MIKAYKHLLPSIAVLLVAAFMHQLRVQHVELTPMLSLMLLYMIGMFAGGIFVFTSEKQHVSG